MFDWSGIFFKEVVEVEIFTWGYLTFMICMALSRFASDTNHRKDRNDRKTFMLSAMPHHCGITPGHHITLYSGLP
jgi:hypothetical protein